MLRCTGYAATEPGGPLRPLTFERRDPRPDDVTLRILYCGVCASDVAAVRGTGPFPLVPGHEMVGEVTATGPDVTRFRPGDRVVMGTIVDSCRACPSCLAEEESYCLEGPTLTYAGTDRHDGTITKGGYSSDILVSDRFLYPFPEGLDPAGVTPLMCAGITTFAPLRHWGAGPGRTVGVVGIGGLGHLAIRFARAMGAEVTAFTTSPAKRDDALALGAHHVIPSNDADALRAAANTLDLILDTASGKHDRAAFLPTLRLDGTLCLLGFTGEPVAFEQIRLTLGRRSIASSGVGGTRHTAEMLDFARTHGIVADVETIRLEDINDGFARLKRGDVRYRLVVDMTRPAPA